MLINWRINDKRVLIVGGGMVASDRVNSLLLSEAIVTVLAPSLSKDLQTMLDDNKFEYINKEYGGAGDLTHAPTGEQYAMVLTAIDDRQVSEKIYYDCKSCRIPVNCADIPPLCDFYFGSMIRRPDVEVMVSTNGAGPGMARRIRKEIEDHMDNDPELRHASAATQAIGKLRQRLRQRLVKEGCRDDDPTLIRKRMKWVSQLCSSQSFEDLSRLDDASIDAKIEEFLRSSAQSGPSTTNID